MTNYQRNKYKQEQAQRLWTYNGIIAKGFKIVDGKAVKE